MDPSEIGETDPLLEEISRAYIGMPSQVWAVSGEGKWHIVNIGTAQNQLSDAPILAADWLYSAVHIHDQVALLKAISDCRNSDQNCAVKIRSKATSTINQAQPIDTEFDLECFINPAIDYVLVMVKQTANNTIVQQPPTVKAQDSAVQETPTKFLGLLSHELRTPLNAIVGFSELLMSGLVDPMNKQKVDEYHHLIHQSARHLLGVINSMLDISKLEAGKYRLRQETLAIQNVIGEVSAIMQPLADKSGVTLLKLCPDGLEMEADPSAMKQILINLVSNAIKFSNTDGYVEIAAELDGEYLNLAVTDQGCGIEPEALKRIGEPFYQAESSHSRQFEGTGLGLSIVKRFAELMAGRMQVSSTPGLGTQVKICLPLCAEECVPVPHDDQDTTIRIAPSRHNSRQSRANLTRWAS